MEVEVERARKERIDRVYRFILNEIAIAERQIDAYKSFRMSWTAIFGAFLVSALGLAISSENFWTDGMQLVHQAMIFAGSGLIAILILSTVRIRYAKKSSSILYLLIFRKEFGLIGSDLPIDDPFNYVIWETSLRRNLDALDQKTQNVLLTNEECETLHGRLHTLITNEVGYNLTEYFKKLNPLVGRSVDEKVKKISIWRRVLTHLGLV